jgi:anthranilate synthase component 1
MIPSADFSELVQRYEAGKAQVVIRRLVSDLETPVSAYFKLAGRRKNAFLLESVEGGEKLGRYSIIGIRPDAIWRCRNGFTEINRRAAADINDFRPDGAHPLSSLKSFIDESRIELPSDAPPMSAGIFGFFGYDMVRQMESLPPCLENVLGTPDAVFMRPTLIAVFDNIRQEISLVSTVRPERGISAQAALDRAFERIEEAVTDLCSPLALPREPARDIDVKDIDLPISNTPQEEYFRMVNCAKDFIAAGDIFQVVLSQRFQAPFPRAPFELYRALRRLNPSPFLFYLEFDRFALVGSSPEILVRVRGQDVTIRPIAGTRRRGVTPEEDARLEADLLGDPKERAEHLMLLDLGRNDVGRSAEIGTVRVTENFVVERYSHVMHIISNVTGKLRKGLHPVDAVVGGFPAGTVTGAPKIRAMEIIDELERHARGVYGGAIGYFSASGDVDTCIALRTALVKDGQMHVQAGAGIVADSAPESEYEECRNKARALFAAALAAIG